MATAILSQTDWTAIEARALKLITQYRNLEWDDAHVAAMCEQRVPYQTARALNLIDGDGNCSFSQAFKAVMMTDRLFDDKSMPMKKAA